MATTMTGKRVEKAPVNPDPYPTYGGRDAQIAWYTKDHEIRMGRMAPTPTSVSKLNLRPVGDGLDLPEPKFPMTPYPQSGSHDERMEWLMRTGVAYRQAGTDQYERAIDYEMLKLQMEEAGKQCLELTNENLDLKQKLNHVERHGIDLVASHLLDESMGFIEREVARQVKELERLVTEAASKTTSESRAIERLNATAVLLNGRIGELEQLSPIWAQIHSGD